MVDTCPEIETIEVATVRQFVRVRAQKTFFGVETLNLKTATT